MSDCWMQQPQVGYTTMPPAATIQGTSSSQQGMAALTTRQKSCNCPLIRAQVSQAGLQPIQQHERGGAPGLQQHSQLQQQIPHYGSRIRSDQSTAGVGNTRWTVIERDNGESHLTDTHHAAAITLPTLPLTPRLPQVGRIEQLTQHKPQQMMRLSSLTASSPQHMILWVDLFYMLSRFDNGGTR
jgi:hypothetical protein